MGPILRPRGPTTGVFASGMGGRVRPGEDALWNSWPRLGALTHHVSRSLCASQLWRAAAQKSKLAGPEVFSPPNPHPEHKIS